MKEIKINHPIEYTYNGLPNKKTGKYKLLCSDTKLVLVAEHHLPALLKEQFAAGKVKLKIDITAVNADDTAALTLLKQQEVIIRGYTQLLKLHAEDIMYGKAAGHSVDVTKTDEEHFTSAFALGASLVGFHSALYIRINKCSFINYLQIKSHSRTPGYHVIMNDDKTIIVGRKYQKEFIKLKKELNF